MLALKSKSEFIEATPQNLKLRFGRLKFRIVRNHHRTKPTTNTAGLIRLVMLFGATHFTLWGVSFRFFRVSGNLTRILPLRLEVVGLY